MTALRIQHASIPVPRDRIEEVVAFYEAAFGMERIPNLAGLAWLRFGDALHVHLLDGRGIPPHPDQHVALHVDDLDATLARVAALGAPLHESDRLWGGRRVFTVDPAGNRLELFDVAPPR